MSRATAALVDPGPSSFRAARRALYAAGFLRALATSAMGVLLGLYLGRIGLSVRATFAVVAAGLSGVAAAALVATLFADRIGRRRFLIGLALLGALGVAGLCFAREPAVLAVFAFGGMVNGMGRDRGGALVIEQAILPATTTAEGRTQAIARYTMLQDMGHALGALLAGAPAWTAGIARLGPSPGASLHRATLLACALLGLASVLLYSRLGEAIERGSTAKAASLSRASRTILLRISALFALDSLAGGFLTTAMLSYFFFERFGVGEGWIGALFFGARVMNSLSHLGAAWLAGKIGLVRTMVFTHIPSSLLLVTVAFAPSFAVAVVLFLLREGLVEMDVPTRQSYVLAVVAPEERTMASGVTNLVRVAAWAVAPAFASLFMAGSSMVPALVIGAAMKIAYDLLLWAAFRRRPPPEEQKQGA